MIMGFSCSVQLVRFRARAGFVFKFLIIHRSLRGACRELRSWQKSCSLDIDQYLFGVHFLREKWTRGTLDQIQIFFSWKMCCEKILIDIPINIIFVMIEACDEFHKVNGLYRRNNLGTSPKTGRLHAAAGWPNCWHATAQTDVQQFQFSFTGEDEIFSSGKTKLPMLATLGILSISRAKNLNITNTDESAQIWAHICPERLMHVGLI